MAGKKERQRQLARQRHARRQARRAQRAHRTRKITTSVLVAVVVILVGVGGVLLASQGSGKKAAASTPVATPSASASPSASPSASTEPAVLTEPAHHCTNTANPPAARKVSVPPSAPDYQATYQATIKTNRGSIVISLLNSKATCTVNSFVHLAAQNYFNNTTCPRLSTTEGLYILQCGGPTGTGTGGPGYEFASENLTGATYPAGTLAMANTTGVPDSNGSQFFMVYQKSTLAPSYTPFGQIVSGLNILQSVGKRGFGPPLSSVGGGKPKESVEIESVTIKKT